jgi:thiosulfate reductase cytochrome b subunit
MNIITHPGGLRILHAINAIAVVGLLLSGIEIYRAAPFFPVRFPMWLSLGGDMKGAIRWHFLLMWVLLGNALVYALIRIKPSNGLVGVLPLSFRELWSDVCMAARFKLAHQTHTYNAIQKWLYASVWLVIMLAMLSGLALWKPIQLGGLSNLLGGYEMSRRVHFVAMTLLLAFVVLHVLMALMVPRTLASILVGRETSAPLKGIS